MRVPLRFLTAGLVLASFLESSRADELQELLARTRDATRSEKLAAHRGGLLFTGKGEFLAVPSTWSFYLAGDGRAVERVEGRLPRVQAHDAKGWWTEDWSGTYREVIGHERASDELDFALLSGALWAETCAWERELGSASTAEEAQVVLKREGLMRDAALWISRSTALPVRVQIEDKDGPAITYAEEWSDRLDFRFPRRLRFTSTGGDSSYTVEEVADAPNFLVDPLRRPSGPPRGTSFDAEQSAAIEIRRAPTKHLLTRARLNGGEERWFLLDSGAGALVIDKQTADSLELESFGEIRASGVGGMAPAHFRPAQRFQIGPLVIEQPILLELDLSKIAPFFGVELAGILGYDVFARAVIELDLETPAASIHDPANFTAPEGTRFEPLLLDNRLPTLRCRFEGDREGLFRLDTGDSGTVTFHTPTVERLQLLEGRKTGAAPLGGVGGFTSARSGKLAWFEVGGKRVEDVKVQFAQAKSGPFSHAELDGNLGTKLLAPFVLYFDYRGQRLGFSARD